MPIRLHPTLIHPIKKHPALIRCKRSMKDAGRSEEVPGGAVLYELATAAGVGDVAGVVVFGDADGVFLS